MTVPEITEAFKELPSMASGSNKILDRFWLNLGVFDAPWVAPTARANKCPDHEHGHRESCVEGCFGGQRLKTMDVESGVVPPVDSVGLATLFPDPMALSTRDARVRGAVAMGRLERG